MIALFYEHEHFFSVCRSVCRSPLNIFISFWLSGLVWRYLFSKPVAAFKVFVFSSHLDISSLLSLIFGKHIWQAIENFFEELSTSVSQRVCLWLISDVGLDVSMI